MVISGKYIVETITGYFWRTEGTKPKARKLMDELIRTTLEEERERINRELISGYLRDQFDVAFPKEEEGSNRSRALVYLAQVALIVANKKKRIKK